jgi:undecaprenyl-diphosphatase
MSPFALVVAGLIVAYLAVRFRRVGWVQRGVGVVVVAALAVYGSGVVNPPSLEDIIKSVGSTLGPYTYVLVGVMAFLEAGAFVGLIAPGETAIILGGVIAGQGKISVVALVFLVWASAVAGAVLSYWLGRRLGREFIERHGPRVKITPERLSEVDAFFVRHGAQAVFLGCFVGVVRAVIPFIAGASRLHVGRYLLSVGAGLGIYGTAYVFVGYLLSESLNQAGSVGGRIGFGVAGAIVLVVGSLVAYRFLRTPENRERARRWLREQERDPRVRAVIRPLRAVAGFIARRMRHNRG